MSPEYKEMTVAELRELIQRQAVEREQFFRDYSRKTEESRKEAEQSRKDAEQSRKDAEQSRKRIEDMELKFQKYREEREEREKREKEQENQRKLEREKEFKLWKEENKRRTKEFREEIGFIGNVQGEIAEDTFRRTIQSLLEGIGIQIDRVLHRLNYSNGVEHFEYDLVAVNGTEIFVFEIKNKLRSKDISKFTEHQLPRFKSLFPEFEHLILYGGFGTLVIGEEMEKQIMQQGLFLLTHSDEAGAKLHVPEQTSLHRGEKT